MKNLICATIVLGLTCAFSTTLCAQQWGDLSARLVYDGPAPKPAPVQITKDADFCGKCNVVDESVVVNPENRGLANVIAWVYVSRGEEGPPVHPALANPVAESVLLDNNKCRFDPHVLLMRTSQTLIMGNSDEIGHNCKIDTYVNPPINVTIPAGGKVEHRLPEDEARPARVSCSIHPWMSGWLLVKDHPYMGVSDKDGKLLIKSLPAGTWTFQFWQEQAGYLSDVTIDGKATQWKRGRPEITIKPGLNDLGEIRLAPAVFNK
jgi:hypothetical protein